MLRSRKALYTLSNNGIKTHDAHEHLELITKFFGTSAFIQYSHNDYCTKCFYETAPIIESRCYVSLVDPALTDPASTVFSDTVMNSIKFMLPNASNCRTRRCSGPSHHMLNLTPSSFLLLDKHSYQSEYLETFSITLGNGSTVNYDIFGGIKYIDDGNSGGHYTASFIDDVYQ